MSFPRSPSFVLCGRRTAPLFAVLLAAFAFAPSPAKALSVAIQYELSGSSGALSLPGLGTPTSLAATAIVNLPTLNATTASGPASLQSLVIMGGGFTGGSGSSSTAPFTWVFPGLPGAADSCAASLCNWLRTGALPLGHAGAYTPISFTQHLATTLRVNLAAGTLRMFASQWVGATGSTGASTLNGGASKTVLGNEISRTAVPEPGTGALVLAVGALALGVQSVRRGRAR
jgi:hypothetical protein